VGGSREFLVDVRVIAATNAPLEKRLAAGTFREDLFFRLNVFTLTLPPLRDRPEDVPLLAQAFIEEYARENEKTVVGYSDEALMMMMRYSWPGNVRELRNAVQRAVILAKEEEIQLADLPPAVRPNVRVDPSRPHSLTIQVGTPLSDVEKAVILETLQVCKGNKTRAAGMLGISAKTLHLKLKQYRGAEEEVRVGDRV
jgi:two-component system response regulator HydG